MAKAVVEEAWVQLATRVPKSLQRDVKLHCVQRGESIMDFVQAAMRERLARNGRKGKK